jgi:hypothetical protein
MEEDNEKVMESIEFVVLQAEELQKKQELLTERVDTERKLLEVENLGTQDNFF